MKYRYLFTFLCLSFALVVFNASASNISNSGSSGGGSAFSSITAGTNGAGLVMGTGGSLTFSGTGTINANQLGGTSIGTPTGTGNVVYSASPTLTGTVTASIINASGASTFSASAAASTSGLLVSGAPFSGGTTTTNFPVLYINTAGATGPTTLSANGTMAALNAPSGFTGMMLAGYVNGGAAVFTISNTGAIVCGAINTSASTITCGAVGSNGKISTSSAGGASAACFGLSGALFTGGTGTTNFPQYFSQHTGTAATTWSTAGTYFGVNADSGFSGNFVDFRTNGGSTLFGVSSAGSVTSAGSLTIGSATLVTTTTAFTNGAGANTGTLTNAPAVGNPTKWIPIVDNGTTRYIPAW